MWKKPDNNIYLACWAYIEGKVIFRAIIKKRWKVESYRWQWSHTIWNGCLLAGGREILSVCICLFCCRVCFLICPCVSMSAVYVCLSVRSRLRNEVFFCNESPALCLLGYLYSLTEWCSSISRCYIPVWFTVNPLLDFQRYVPTCTVSTQVLYLLIWPTYFKCFSANGY